ncbi:hypothetical protein E1B28_011668 [Marasmius oreades]|uniref:DUF6535 domain-containing protein n=1 Tax=Marasmius oreades TaxID=181124 RepID=A0A9P7USC1_9AGAR|nr:uncharacterized protein E1B28_011668 [Marasmius oreades]KAG7090049.1 hypothetical protein E1B28_011668 [Marasmius oreades]
MATNISHQLQTGTGTSPRSQSNGPQKPTFQASWDAIVKEIDAHDDGRMKGYKEDIDTLLVFAGLFSAVVTAFTVESYQWLSEDPADITVTLLTQISKQLSGQAIAIPEPAPFSPTLSSVRINTFWFLSLTLSLVDALFGLLCKQWLREHQRQVHTRTPGEALALRWLRNESFERWHVPKILAALPILLEIALFLFFAGLLDLLWARHQIPYATTMVVLGFAILVYLATTIIPGISIIQQALQLHPFSKRWWPHELIFQLPPIQFVCPYKSPQSWLIVRLFSAISHLPGFKHVFRVVISKRFNVYPSSEGVTLSIKENVHNLSDWSALDATVIRRFSNMNSCPDIYRLLGFRWLVREFQDLPSMIPHLRNVLEQPDLPPYLVMPCVFDEWIALQEREWQPTFLDGYIGIGNHVPALVASRDGGGNSSSSPYYPRKDFVLFSQLLYFRHLIFVAWNFQPFNPAKTVSIQRKIWKNVVNNPEDRHEIGFLIPFVAVEGMLDMVDTVNANLNGGVNPSLSLVFEVLGFYLDCWNHVGRQSRRELLAALAKHITDSLPWPPEAKAKGEGEGEIRSGSVLVTSPKGLGFLTSVHNMLVYDSMWHHGGERVSIYLWLDALNRVKTFHGLLANHHFQPIPGYFSVSPERLETILTEDGDPTSESVIFDFSDSFQQAWKTVSLRDRCRMVGILSNHMDRFPLEFLSMVNDKLLAEAYPCFIPEQLAQSWSTALECHVRVVKSLPPGYFKPIPSIDSPAEAEIVKWTRGIERG